MMSQRPPGGLPSQPEPNPKKSAKPITLKSRKGYENLPMPETNEVVKNHQASIDENKDSIEMKDLKNDRQK